MEFHGSQVIRRLTLSECDILVLANIFYICEYITIAKINELPELLLDARDKKNMAGLDCRTGLEMDSKVRKTMKEHFSFSRICDCLGFEEIVLGCFI